MRRITAIAFCCCLLLVAMQSDAWAKKAKAKSARQAPAAPQPMGDSLQVKAALVYDMASGDVLFEQDPDERIPPASLTKIMTMYLVWELIEQGKASLDDAVKISAAAANTGGSTMNLKAGETVTISQLMHGMAIASGNDACVAIAEHFGGVSQFVARMNRKAAALGMTSTTFKNPNGLPAAGQITTAKDFLLLSLSYLKRFPHSLTIHSKTSITHNKYTRTNSNRLLGSVPGVDGLKTGYVSASGFNIVVTAKRGQRRLVAVVLGGASWAVRNREAARVLNACYDGYTPKRPIMAKVTPPVDVPAKPGQETPFTPAELAMADAAPPMLGQGHEDQEDEELVEASALADELALLPPAPPVTPILAAEAAKKPAPGNAPQTAKLAAPAPAAPAAPAVTAPPVVATVAPVVPMPPATPAASGSPAYVVSTPVLSPAASAPAVAQAPAAGKDYVVSTPVYQYTEAGAPSVRGKIDRAIASVPALPAVASGAPVRAIAPAMAPAIAPAVQTQFPTAVSLQTQTPPRGLPQPAPREQGVYYSIQESSWKDRDGAVDHAQKLRDGGFDARVVSVELGKKGVWHRVVIGSFTDLDTARDYREKLVSKHKMDQTLIIKMDATMENAQAMR